MQALTVGVSSIGEDGAAALKAEVHRLRSEDLPPWSLPVSAISLSTRRHWSERAGRPRSPFSRSASKSERNRVFLDLIDKDL